MNSSFRSNSDHELIFKFIFACSPSHLGCIILTIKRKVMNDLHSFCGHAARVLLLLRLSASDDGKLLFASSVFQLPSKERTTSGMQGSEKIKYAALDDTVERRSKRVYVNS